jgi:hypothetical protein
MEYIGLPLSMTRLKRIHFQGLKDTVIAKLVPWIGKHATMVGCLMLVKAVLTSHLFCKKNEIPLEVLLNIDSIRRAFLWAASETVTGGKCKVNWDLVCKPKECGGLVILSLTKFASALRLRWLWNEWRGTTSRGWARPCNSKNCDIFATTTMVTVGNGEKSTFWASA